MVKRILLGQFPGGDIGMRVSLAGYDVTTNPIDNTKLAFSSDWPSLLPVYQKGSFSITSSGSSWSVSNSASFTSLGYVPYVAAFIYGDNTVNGLTAYWLQNQAWFSQTNEGETGILVDVTSSTVTGTIQGFPSGYTYTFYYSIFYLQAI